MDLRLPPELARSFTARETGPDDIHAVYDVIVADRMYDTGACRIQRDVIKHLLVASSPHLSGAVERDGQMQQVWTVLLEPGTTSFHADVFTRPGLVEREALEDVAWQRVAEWATGVVLDPLEGVLRTGRPLQDQDAPARLARSGFRRTHTFWHMGGDVATAPERRHAPPDGLEVEAHADPRVVHDLMQEGFVDHYGFSPQTFEDAMTQFGDRPGFDPDGWYLARLDGRPAGAMVLSWEQAPHDALLVMLLATLTWARGRGVGTTLLRQAFDVAPTQGLSRLELYVDSENSTGAPSLYRTVGLDVMQASDQFERPLVLTSPQP